MLIDRTSNETKTKTESGEACAALTINNAHFLHTRRTRRPDTRWRESTRTRGESTPDEHTLRSARGARARGARARSRVNPPAHDRGKPLRSSNHISARTINYQAAHKALNGQSKHQQSYKTRRDHDLGARQSAGSSTNRPHTHPMRQPAHPRSALWGRVRACPQVPRERAVRSMLCVLTRRGARPPRRSTCSRACRHRAAASPARQQVSM